MKTFPGQSGWLVSFLSLLTFVLLPHPAAFAASADVEEQEAAGAGVDLTGVAKTADGKPVAGARVFIYTAGPKVGAGLLCPSCYADCRKRAETDADGHFKIPTLAPSLLFKVLVAAPGYQPTFVAGVDPAKGAIEATLKPVLKSEAQNMMRGRVMDFTGRPITGAVVEIRGVTRGTSTRFGGNADVDPLAVSDDDGLFTIHSTTAFEAVGVDVEARGFAKGIFRALASGEKVHELKLGEGATIKGRLVKEGAPVSGREIGISGSDRNSEIYVGNMVIKTDANGQFLFSNVTPSVSYEIYGIMQSLGTIGCVPSQTIKAGGHGTVLNVGDLKVEQGYLVAGTLKLTDGKPLPEKTRVMLGREKAWDSRLTEVDAEGRFRFEGVPMESISMYARVKDYRMSARNSSLDPLNPGSLIGMVIGNTTNLVIELEPGERLTERLDGSQTAIRQEPIRGAEKGGETAEEGIRVTGTAVDAETGKPLKLFSVMEGRWAEFPPDSVDWFKARTTDGINGQFSVTFAQPRRGREGARPTGQARAVRIEAPGYLPEKSGKIFGDTNLTFALRRGEGPGGVLLNPDGSPAASTKVYLTDMRNGVYVSGDTMRVNERSYSGTQSTTTDEQGQFSFPASTESYSVIALTDDGYVEAKVADLKAGQKVTLQPWARVEGTLMIGTRPAAGEQIHLNLLQPPYANHPRHFPALSFYAHATTDEEGKFVFAKAPPLLMTLYHSPKARDGRTGIIPQAQTVKLSLEPGKTEKVTLGGRGRPVIGKMTLTGYDGTINWRSDVQNLERKPETPVGLPDFQAMSKDYAGKMRAAKSDEEKAALKAGIEEESARMQERMREFYKTPEGLAYFAKQTRDALVFKEDGSFRAEDIEPGKYVLRIELREPGEMDRFRAPLIARMEKEIEVPGAEGEQNDEAFDLGVIELTARTMTKEGQMAAAFETKTVDGKTLRLADYKGKFVLLDFWAVWCGPCVAETPFLKETYEAFKNDGRFAMIGLSLDPEKEEPIAYAKKNKLGWTQGFLGEWSKADLPNQYGVEGIPAIFLIGPDGKIIEKNLRGEQIMQAVRKALAK